MHISLKILHSQSSDVTFPGHTCLIISKTEFPHHLLKSLTLYLAYI